MKYSFKSSNLLNTLYCRVSLLLLFKHFFFVTKCKINKQRFRGSTSTVWFFVFLIPGWLVFEERGKPEYLEKNLSGGNEGTNNKLNPHAASTPELEPGPHWWEASTLTTATPLLPTSVAINVCQYFSVFQYFHNSMSSKSHLPGR